MSVKRYTWILGDNGDPVVVEDSRSMEFESVRCDSYVLAADYEASETDLAATKEMYITAMARIAALEAGRASWMDTRHELEERIRELEAALREAGSQVYGGGWIDHSGDCQAGLEGCKCTCGLVEWIQRNETALGIKLPRAALGNSDEQ